MVVIDDVLQDPHVVRETIGDTPATNWKLVEGGRNFLDYYDCRLRFPVFPPVGLIALAQRTIEAAYRVSTEPQLNSIDVNWFMQIGAKPANYAVPHQDAMIPGKRTFTCMVYLNSPDECSGGTGFFRFPKTQSMVADERFNNAVRDDVRLRESKEGEYWPPDADA